MVFAGGAFERRLGHEGEAFIKQALDSSLPLHRMKTQQENSCLRTRNQVYTLILDFPDFRILENNFLLFSAIFVIAAQMA